MFGVYAFGVPAFGDAVFTATPTPPVPPTPAGLQPGGGGSGHLRLRAPGHFATDRFLQQPSAEPPASSAYEKIVGAMVHAQDEQDVADVLSGFLQIKDRFRP